MEFMKFPLIQKIVSYSPHATHIMRAIFKIKYKNNNNDGIIHFTSVNSGIRVRALQKLISTITITLYKNKNTHNYDKTRLAEYLQYLIQCLLNRDAVAKS